MKKFLEISPSWQDKMNKYIESKSFSRLSDSVQNEFKTKIVYPARENIFRAFSLTPFDDIHVVILGQDPYHGESQAHGLSFSVPIGTKVPPSLKNIYKEIESDLVVKKDHNDGNLEKWALQGVLLLNSVLTVLADSPASHKDIGWEEFTDAVIKKISEEKENVVFMLWGNFAKNKKVLIDTRKHLVLEAAHPSPFSAHSGFFGCKHFSLCNEYLKEHNLKEINW